MREHKYTCIRPDLGEIHPRDAMDFSSGWNKDEQEYIAEDAAKHLGSSFPEALPEMGETFELELFLDGVSLGIYLVEADWEYIFHAEAKEQS